MQRLNQITEHAISEFQRLRIDALEKENASLVADNHELKCANKLAHEKIQELQSSIDVTARYVERTRKKRESLELCVRRMQESNDKLHQQLANAKRDLVSKQLSYGTKSNPSRNQRRNCKHLTKTKSILQR